MLRNFERLRANVTISTLGAACILLSCGQPQKPSPPGAVVASTPASTGGAVRLERQNDEVALSQGAAKGRAKAIGSVQYDLSFQLSEKQKIFSGIARLKFEWKPVLSRLVVDFKGGVIDGVKVNGAPNTEAVYNGLFLSIPAAALVAGSNEVEIQFQHPYSQSSSGLHRYLDARDKKVYLYTDLEPFKANEVFPCFDQPNLKATFGIKVEAPKDWQVVTATRESNVEVRRKENRKVWTFALSQPISTYLFSLHAGPYKVWEEKKYRIPLRILARPGLAPFIKTREWFEITKKGFDFYEGYFDRPYPFQKYDQVLVPEFQSGAMENVAAVTFSEKFVRRGEPSRAEQRRFANVILHEMAHMWFGNLVTLDWWNDLWLNESFASYMSALALSEATEFKEAWVEFFYDMKNWAYSEDQRITTHSIESLVKDTDSAFTQFDGITYGKGASTLKQLAYVVGRENFQKVVRGFIKKFEFKNATFEDWLGEFVASGAQANGDLQKWARSWIRTAGLNVVRPRLTCKDDKIKSVYLIQDAALLTFPELRSHKTQLAFFWSKSGAALEVKEVTQVYQGAETRVDAVTGWPCPTLIHINSDDHDYMRTGLDSSSLEFILQKPWPSEMSPLSRAVLWRALWDMVREGELSVVQFGEAANRSLTSESDLLVLNGVLSYLIGADSHDESVLFFLSGDRALAPIQSQLIQGLEELAWKKLKEPKMERDQRLLWLNALIRVATNPATLDRLTEVLKGRIPTLNRMVDQDRRWKIIARMSLMNYRWADLFRNTELKRDNSLRGREAGLGAQVLQPLIKAKRQWFTEVSNPTGQYSGSELRVVAENLFPVEQRQFRALFADRFFESVLKIQPGADPYWVEALVENLTPALCTPEGNLGLKDFLTKNASQIGSVALKSLRNQYDEDVRCLKIRQKTKALLPSDPSPSPPTN